jgi:glycosyltransferase involved in cell wall biosynthesis
MNKKGVKTNDKIPKVAIFLTAYNEAMIISDIIDNINKSYSVFVIDDGSKDNIVEVCRARGANVISHLINLGQGNAVITMFRLATLLDYDYIIHMDADGQHNPKEIYKFIDKIQETGADIVAGSRVLGSNYKGAPVARRLFLSPLTWVLNRLTGYNISDSMCGFRAFRTEALRKVEHFFDDMVEPEYLASEMWIKFAKAGLTATEVPITLAGRKHGFSYKGLFRYGWGVVTTIIRSKMDIYKYKY